ncbi:DUF3168 domain-containing protein [Shimia sp.]|uniref:DUF3168 domain-containing protein n=1 Tax=Shimia sp. TaxID=1954381 RepID=UPI003299B337
MSYALAESLQSAIYQTLIGDVDLSALVQGAVYDEIPSGTLPETYVVLGSETTVDRSDANSFGAEHRFTVSVLTSAGGFVQAKRAASAVSDALHQSDLTMTRGRLVYLNFEKASARRDSTAGLRRIDLRFRARVEEEQP